MKSALEHAIEQSARIVRDGDPEGMGYAQAHNIARALADAGLLAPGPLREEWATRFENGRLRPGKDMPYDLWWKGDPPKGENVRRYVTDYVPVDRAEGDGRTE